MNPYEVLGIKPGASDDEIKAAYKSLVKKYHPDKYQNNPLSDLAEEKLQEVNEAYDTLMKGTGRGSSGSSYSGGYNAGSSGGYNQGSYGHSGYNTNSGYGGGYNTYSSGSTGPLNEVRRAIDRGSLDEAEAMLAREPNQNAEWMFLSGMISYKRGWYDDAAGKIQRAVSMEPYNQEYRMALNNISGSGNIYRNNAFNQGYNTNQDAFCQALSCFCCADACCDCF